MQFFVIWEDNYYYIKYYVYKNITNEINSDNNTILYYYLMYRWSVWVFTAINRPLYCT